MEQIVGWIDLAAGWPAWVWVCGVALVVILGVPLVLLARGYEVEIEVRPMPERWARRVRTDGCAEE